jgi:hypothetical protein
MEEDNMEEDNPTNDTTHDRLRQPFCPGARSIGCTKCNKDSRFGVMRSKCCALLTL